MRLIEPFVSDNVAPRPVVRAMTCSEAQRVARGAVPGRALRAGEQRPFTWHGSQLPSRTLLGEVLPTRALPRVATVGAARYRYDTDPSGDCAHQVADRWAGMLVRDALPLPATRGVADRIQRRHCFGGQKPRVRGTADREVDRQRVRSAVGGAMDCGDSGSESGLQQRSAGHPATARRRRGCFTQWYDLGCLRLHPAQWSAQRRRAPGCGPTRLPRCYRPDHARDSVSGPSWRARST